MVPDLRSIFGSRARFELLTIAIDVEHAESLLEVGNFLFA